MLLRPLAVVAVFKIWIGEFCELQTIQNLTADSQEVSAFTRAVLDWSYNEPWDHKIEEEPLNIVSASMPMPVTAIDDSKHLPEGSKFQHDHR